MATKIFYYTGTGNSLWVARRLAGRLESTELLSMTGYRGEGRKADFDSLGLVFPVYIWGVPAPVISFIESWNVPWPGYVFAVAVNGGQVSNTLVQLGKVLSQRGAVLSAGFEVKMPSNYIPWGGPGPVEKQRKLFDEADRKIDRFAGYLMERRHMPVEKGPLWQRLIFSAIYRMTFGKVPGMDSGFRADGKCNECGICRRVCPADNITLLQGRPVWNHRCHQCFACLQWCPQEAIQYGKKTPAYERYHHPEITLKDILKSA